jgi:hypothetical protein
MPQYPVPKLEQTRRETGRIGRTKKLIWIFTFPSLYKRLHFSCPPVKFADYLLMTDGHGRFIKSFLAVKIIIINNHYYSLEAARNSLYVIRTSDRPKCRPKGCGSYPTAAP